MGDRSSAYDATGGYRAAVAADDYPDPLLASCAYPATYTPPPPPPLPPAPGPSSSAAASGAGGAGTDGNGGRGTGEDADADRSFQALIRRHGKFVRG